MSSASMAVEAEPIPERSGRLEVGDELAAAHAGDRPGRAGLYDPGLPLQSSVMAK